MIVESLVSPLRIVMGVTAVLCALSFYRFFNVNQKNLTSEKKSTFLKYLLVWILIMGLAAFAFTHTPIVELGGKFLPHGVVPGYILAFGSLFWKPARDAFDQLSDHQIKHLMQYRVIFGAFLFAGAGFGLFPPVFALVAGTGDIAAGWFAIVASKSIAKEGSPKWRWLVHGFGALDLVDVAVLGTLVVQPWLVENQSLGPSLLLPWLAVPLLFSLNLHGLRRTYVDSFSNP